MKPYHNLVIIAGSSSLRYKSAYHADVILVTVEFQPNNATSSNDLALIKVNVFKNISTIGKKRETIFQIIFFSSCVKQYGIVTMQVK